MLLRRVQFLAKHFGDPLGYRVCSFIEFATRELRHDAIAAAMRVLSQEHPVSMGQEERCVANDVDGR